MKILLLAFALTILPASLGLAQNAPAPPPKALLENEQIRVREIKLAPGAKLPAEQRPNTFLYALTDGSIVFTPPGRKGYELTVQGRRGAVAAVAGDRDLERERQGSSRLAGRDQGASARRKEGAGASKGSKKGTKEGCGQGLSAASRDIFGLPDLIENGSRAFGEISP